MLRLCGAFRQYVHLVHCLTMCNDLPNTDVFSQESFMESFTVVMAASCYLPSASCFALLPLLGSIQRSGRGTAMVDYDSELDAAVLVATCDLPRGSEVTIYDDRPNGEMLLSTGRYTPWLFSA